MKRIGIIGFGVRMSKDLASKYFQHYFEDMMVAAIADIDLEKVRERIDDIPGWDIEKISLYTDAIEMLDNEELDGVMIGTRCNLHSRFAIEVLNRNIPVFLEKPVSTTLEDYYKLKEAVEKSEAGGITSFPLRLTLLVKKAKEIYESGALGTLSQIQAWNNVNYGRVYYKDWYRDESITGGLFLQKATHDVDYINYVLGKQPIELCAMESKMVFKGDKPANLKCEDCPEVDTCYESAKIIREKYDEQVADYCSYGVDVGNHDSATILMRYDDGLHVVYTQNFVVRKKAGKRGMRMIGQKATLEFDWDDDTLKFIHHEERKTENYYLIPPAGIGHSGGDYHLIEDFYALICGDKSVSSLKAGLDSAYVCLKACESAKTHKFMTL